MLYLWILESLLSFYYIISARYDIYNFFDSHRLVNASQAHVAAACSRYSSFIVIWKSGPNYKYCF